MHDVCDRVARDPMKARPKKKPSPSSKRKRATGALQDVIVSGGENISSVEVEDTLYRHPAVMSAAVVAQPDEKWGETPCAFIELKPGASATADDLRDFCRAHMARFKVPKTFLFRDIPKTSTGKIQKFVLRQLAKSAAAIE